MALDHCSVLSEADRLAVDKVRQSRVVGLAARTVLVSKSAAYPVEVEDVVGSLGVVDAVDSAPHTVAVAGSPDSVAAGLEVGSLVVVLVVDRHMVPDVAVVARKCSLTIVGV